MDAVDKQKIRKQVKQFWGGRIEGQLRHLTKAQPEYFNGKRRRKDYIQSASKRILGEIAAVYIKYGSNTGPNDPSMCGSVNDDNDCNLLSSGVDVFRMSTSNVGMGDMDTHRSANRREESTSSIVPPVIKIYQKIKWFNFKKIKPTTPTKSAKPYLVTYKLNKTGKKFIIEGIWTGTEWKFFSKRHKNLITERVIAWAYYPEPYED